MKKYLFIPLLIISIFLIGCDKIIPNNNIQVPNNSGNPTDTNDNDTNKFITLNDLIIYKITSIISNNQQISSLIKFDIIKNMDKSLLSTGINFIENDLNISKTSNILFLHRNTLIYRLEKIKEYLNLDLKNFKDAFIFYLSVKSFLNFMNNYNS